MIKTKKQMYIVIGAFALILLLGATSYAFFSYTRTRSGNTVATGRISFTTTQETINLSNAFPVDVTGGIPNDANNVGVATINVKGDTTYGEGIEYKVEAVGLTNTVGSGANTKSVPISIDVSVTNNTVNDPATNLGNSDDSYYSNRGGSSSIYKIEAGNTINTNDLLLVGYIAEGAQGVDGNIVIKAYFDMSKIAITDTDEESEWAQGKRVFTTSEWNSLRTNGVSFQVRVTAQEGVWLPEPPVAYEAGIKCQRVTSAAKLHTETCSQSSNYCYADGYRVGGSKNTTTITYGTAKAVGDQSGLVAGDAFDCDVNGNGVVDVDANNNSTERFYYVSPYYNTSNQTFDGTTSSDYATLIYYSNTVGGVASTGNSAYYASANENWHGPATAAGNLPTTGQWSNITLKTASRTILAEYQSTHNSSTTSGGTLPTDFSYSGKAARLLTAQELMNGCNLTQVGNYTTGELSGCNFLFEGTKYSTSTNAPQGSWLETPHASSASGVWLAYSNDRSVNYGNANFASSGARPAIDVQRSNILY